MIFIDMDGVLADLHTAWFGWFNDVTGRHGRDRINWRDAKDWHLTDLIPDDERDEFFSILHKRELYTTVDPIPGGLQFVQWLDDLGVEWAIATSCVSPEMVAAKVEWARDHGFARERRTAPHRAGWPVNLIPISNKGLLRGEVLIDDGAHNLAGFSGLQILFDQPYNRGETDYIRVRSFPEIVQVLTERHIVPPHPSTGLDI